MAFKFIYKIGRPYYLVGHYIHSSIQILYTFIDNVYDKNIKK